MTLLYSLWASWINSTPATSIISSCVSQSHDQMFAKIVTRVCQMLSRWTKNLAQSINIWDTVTKVLPLRSVYQEPTYEPNLTLLAWPLPELAHLSMLLIFIFEVVCTASSAEGNINLHSIPTLTPPHPRTPLQEACLSIKFCCTIHRSDGGSSSDGSNNYSSSNSSRKIACRSSG